MARGIGHSRCGKLLVATGDAQVAQSQEIIGKAAANGARDLVLLTRDEARALEPQLECVAAVHSPSTGIVDSHALMLALQGDLENAGGLVVLNSPLAQARCAQGAIILVANDGTELQARSVVNAAGLHAQALARRFAGLDWPTLAPMCSGSTRRMIWWWTRRGVMGLMLKFANTGLRCRTVP